MLRFYWQLGKELHNRKNRFSYGQSFYKTISRDLRKELPDVSESSNLPQLGEDFRSGEIEPLFAIPWGHHKLIMDKCSGNPQKAQYALESSSQPLGVSAYELSKLIPENFKGSLPSIDEIESELQKDVND